jgi:hypothetical protein
LIASGGQEGGDSEHQEGYVFHIFSQLKTGLLEESLPQRIGQPVPLGGLAQLRKSGHLSSVNRPRHFIRIRKICLSMFAIRSDRTGKSAWMCNPNKRR